MLAGWFESYVPCLCGKNIVGPPIVIAIMSLV